MSVPIVSVCMITYNHEKYIAQAIEGVLMQKTEFNYNLIIGEDCSNDRTRFICKKYQSSNPNKIVLLDSNENLGPLRNFTRTLRECNGKYIAICEGDDFWTDDKKLSMQVNMMESNKKLSMCFTNRRLIDTENQILSEDTISPKYKKLVNSRDIILNFTPPTQTILFRSEFLEEFILEGLEMVFNGDLFLSALISLKGKVGYIDEVTANYRVTNEGIYSGINFLTRLEHKIKTLKILNKHLSSEKQKLVKRRIAGINQQLYIAYFKDRNTRLFLFKMAHLIYYDIRYMKLTFIKANKLLYHNLKHKIELVG